MNLQFLGGVGEIGRSAVLIDDSLLLDYGMLTANPPQYPVGDVDPDAVVVSHGHLDHAGAVPSLLSGTARPSVHWTPPTDELSQLLARDTLKLHGGTMACPFTGEDVRRVSEVSTTHGYGEPFEAAGYRVTFYDAGHIPGSAHVLVDDSAGRSPASSRAKPDDSEVQRTSGSRTQSGDGGTRLLYTADFHTDDQRIVPGTSARPEADVVVTESTYADVEHDDRAAIERRFVESVRTTLWEGGTVVVPAFAIGRTQEMMLICAAHDIDCYVDGMGKEVTRILRRHDGFVRDADALKRAHGHARFVDGRDGQRSRITDQQAAIITTSGMLGGGPAMRYIPEIRSNPVNKITLTGYQVEGTPGRNLLDTGSAEIDGRVMPVAAQVESYDFSAHADRDGLRSFLDAYEDSEILVVHGDRTEWFAERLREDGYDASAPELGERVAV